MSAPFSRRSFLQGLGTALGTAPLYDFRNAFGQTVTAPRRLVLVHLDSGWGHNIRGPGFGWRAGEEYGPGGSTIIGSGSGSSWSFRWGLSPLNAIKDECVFIDGVRGSIWGNGHHVGTPDMFTAAVPYMEETSSMPGMGAFPQPMGPSIDWFLGNQLNKNVLRLNQSQQIGSRVMCFDGSFNEIPFYSDTQVTYDALINQFRALQGTVVSDLQKQRISRTELFGVVRSRLQEMNVGVPQASENLLRGYLNGITNLEAALTSAPVPGFPLANETIPARPAGGSDSQAKQLDDYFRMIRLAFIGNTHQIVVLSTGYSADNFTWTDANGVQRTGIPQELFPQRDSHNNVAHHMTNAHAHLCRTAFVAWKAARIVEFVNMLRSTPDVDGNNLLDNTLIVLTGDIGDGEHQRIRKGITLIGGRNLGIVRNRVITTPIIRESESNPDPLFRYQRRTGEIVQVRYAGWQYYQSGIISGSSEGDLWVAVARAMGSNITTFGLPAQILTPINLR